MLTLEWYLASLAGMYKLIMFLIKAVFGSYLHFVSKIRWVKKLYRFDITRFKNHQSVDVQNKLLKKATMITFD